ncbi:MAG TPA: VOC family protein [Anaerolineae bacterium]
MITDLSHLQINVRPENLGFYKDLMARLGWTTIHADNATIGVKGTDRNSLWFCAIAKKVNNDYDGPGMNHIGISAPAMADVDNVCEWLKEHDVAMLFSTPRHRPEFTGSADQTYYQVMFESPDRILWEVVYYGPK